MSAGRVDLHRRLGLVGFGLAALMPILGLPAAADSLRRNLSPPGSGIDAIPVSDMAVFAGLILFAYRERTETASHKRLILLATIALVDAPTGRPPFAAITARPHFDSGFLRHRVTIWGGRAMVLAQQIRFPVGLTRTWQTFAAWVQALAQG